MVNKGKVRTVLLHKRVNLNGLPHKVTIFFVRLLCNAKRLTHFQR